MLGACEYNPKKAREYQLESTGSMKIEILRLAGVGIIALLVAWLQVLQPDWLAKAVIIIAVGIGGYPLFRESAHALRKWRVNMELSMVVAIIASLALLQFLPAIVVTFFALVSEFVEGLIVSTGRKNIESLYRLAPRMAIVKDRAGHTFSTEIEKVAVGDVIIAREGDIIPVDGVILAGASAVDQSSITGESIPVDKKKGDRVFAGTLNLTHQVEILAEKKSSETTFAKIIHLVEEAEASKAPIQKLTDKMAARLIQFAIGLSVITYIVTQNVVSTLSVIVVAGACGLAVGTPIALLATTGKFSRHGIVTKGGLQIENLSHAGTIVFDKTGTLTHGELEVTQVVSIGSTSPKKILEYAAMVEKNVNHPIATAISEKAMAEGIAVMAASSRASDVGLVGRGILGTYGSLRIGVGNLEFAQNEVSDQRIKERLRGRSDSFKFLINEQKDASGRTVQVVRQSEVDLFDFALTTIFVTVNRQLEGAIFLEDSLRPDARKAVDELKSMGIRVVMLTGDNKRIAKRISDDVGIDEFGAELLPDDKVARIDEIVRKSPPGKTVVMVGDGVNDAPALAKANVGIAMGKTGTDVAIETADVVLMTEDLMKIPYLIKRSRGSIFVVRQNFFGTLSVDGIGFVLAFTGHINPLLAALIHVSSELVFMVNSARLIFEKNS
ncbi:MAG TPA: cation-translocating P-type ATPase [Candidatus Nitrosotalea sp.]|nr:cation-translocating P-type ATPase [Candidatus Nitrosotalea sp.]